MAWNEPGKGGKNPWEDKDPGGDVEAFIARLKANLGRMFGNSGPPPKRGAGGGANPLGWIAAVLVVWLLFDSWQVINARQRGVVLRFGKFDRLMEPGPNFKLPRPFESVTKVDVTQIKTFTDQVRILTRDENIVQIEFNVQYLVSDPQKFLFGARDPEPTLQQAAESAVRDVIGTSAMDTILTGERAALAAQARVKLQNLLDNYSTGLQVSVLNIPNARPPQEVREAFDDAVSAREDKDRIESEAEAYASKVVPEARGDAARIRAEAEGYKESTVARAQGDAERFTLLADQYRKAPEVTRTRLYLETMQQVLMGNRKVYAGDGGNVLYLPLSGGATGSASAPGTGNLVSLLPPATTAAKAVEAADPRSPRPPRTAREESR
ncbi:MAG: FtsH protease activity modulator HflK [Xanthomonadaceae bacterium]|nr:FtsH protease activity modulator HflK [Xanthomonadaceae bacterium]